MFSPAALRRLTRDTTPSGLWLERAVELYSNIRTRQDVKLWKALFDDDVFLSLEEEENCREKLLRFLTSSGGRRTRTTTASWNITTAAGRHCMRAG